MLSFSSRHKIFQVISKAVTTRRNVSFGKIEISEALSQRLQEKGIYEPTEIQEKAMNSILDKKNVIVNSETGSGKTLCYLLPIFEQLKASRRTFRDKVISVSRALILAPSMELAYQIGNVCKDIAGIECNVACASSPLCVKDNTEIIVTIPAILFNYQWQSIDNIDCIVFDEVDVLLVQQFVHMKRLLEFYTGRKLHGSRKEKARQKIKESKRKYVFQKSDKAHQFIFVGATIPSGGRKTALSLIEGFVPSATLIKSCAAHKAVKNVTFEYIEAKDDLNTKVTQLTALLEEELAAKETVADGTVLIASERDLCDKSDSSQKPLRAIIYMNNVDNAKNLFAELTKDDIKHYKKSKFFSKSYPEEVSELHASVGSENNKGGPATLSLAEFRKKWKNQIRILYREIAEEERLDIIDGLSKRKYNILITTDLAARGLDIPNVDLIVQFDFASNVTGILHRAGRTGRAGAKGKVVSFITEKNEDLYRLFRTSVDNDEDISKLFSRRRRLRRRIKEGKILARKSYS